MLHNRYTFLSTYVSLFIGLQNYSKSKSELYQNSKNPWPLDRSRKPPSLSDCTKNNPWIMHRPPRHESGSIRTRCVSRACSRTCELHENESGLRWFMGSVWTANLPAHHACTTCHACKHSLVHTIHGGPLEKGPHALGRLHCGLACCRPGHPQAMHLWAASPCLVC